MQKPQSSTSVPAKPQTHFTRIDFYEVVKKAATAPVQKPAPKAK